MQRDIQRLLDETSRGDPIVVVVLRCAAIGLCMFSIRPGSVLRILSMMLLRRGGRWMAMVEDIR